MSSTISATIGYTYETATEVQPNPQAQPGPANRLSQSYVTRPKS